VLPLKLSNMVLRKSSALAWVSCPPHSCSTAARSADHERRTAVTPAWNSCIGFRTGGVVDAIVGNGLGWFGLVLLNF